MKEKRNCGMNNYPVYPGPVMVPPMGYPVGMPGNFAGNMPGSYTGGISSNTFEQQINNMEQQINLLDQRVTRLEKLNNSSTTNNYTKYNDSNYYMV